MFSDRQVTHTDTNSPSLSSLGNNSLQKPKQFLFKLHFLFGTYFEPSFRGNTENTEALKHSSTNSRFVNKWELGHEDVRTATCLRDTASVTSTSLHPLSLCCFPKTRWGKHFPERQAQSQQLLHLLPPHSYGGRCWRPKKQNLPKQRASALLRRDSLS